MHSIRIPYLNYSKMDNKITCADLLPSMDQAFQRYVGFMQESPITTFGSNTLRGGTRSFCPCVLDRTEWENFYQTLPVDYDIRNDKCFDLHRSTYNRLMDVGAPTPEPTTYEALRTGYCGPDGACGARPAKIRGIDCRPEPAYRFHLNDRTALNLMRADHIEGVLPWGRRGDMCSAKGVSHRDFKWRALCCDVRPKHHTLDREVHRIAKTDLHGRGDWCKVVKFDDDNKEEYFKNRLVKLKKAHLWPINPITREPLGGSLSYYQHDPCRRNREEIYPMGEKNYLEECPLRIPHDRCRALAHYPKEIPRSRDRHFSNKSYLDMRKAFQKQNPRQDPVPAKIKCSCSSFTSWIRCI
ncbi:unnamed protein product [Allacma fusca]|uniref:Uncharacterized protein n=1 Tax=Allacma fusca TaxID=39272 RepID=A0A8J2PUA1_9HEXA|nr:unnamed protein product [Allacma fusca]